MEANELKKKSADNDNKKMFRSRFDIFVLNALDDESCEGYGYDVVNYIQTKTKGHYKIKTFSTVYNTLKRLEEQNLVISHKGGTESNGAVRTYYSLTDEGKEYLENDKREYRYLRTLLDNLLTDEDFDLDAEEVPYSASTLKPLTKRARDNDGVNLSISDAQPVEELTSEVVASISNTNDVEEVVPSVVLNNKIASDKLIKKSDDKSYKLVMEKITKPVFDAQKLAKKEQSALQKPKTVYTNKAVKKVITTAEKPVQISPNVKPTKNIVESSKSSVDEYTNLLKSEGYVLKSYNNTPINTEKKVKYVFINKILRDSVILTSLFVIMTLLILFLCKDVFNFPNAGIFSVGGVAIALALVMTIIWLRKPEKRIKDKINLKLLNSVCIAIFLVFFVLDLIVALLIPNGKSLNSPQIYSPIIIATSVLFFGTIFSILYKTENYFQK